MDNFQMDVTCEGRETFDLAMQLAFTEYNTATHYVKDPLLGFVFLWHKEGDSPELPIPLSWMGASSLTWAWLATADYGEEPDHDGSNGKGWRVYNEEWGHVGDYHYAIVAVQPRWAEYGK